jgi:BNR repeat-like domain
MRQQDPPMTGIRLSSLKGSIRFWSILGGILLLAAAVSCNRSKHSSEEDFSLELSSNPAAPGSIAPNMTQGQGGEVVLSWIEPAQGRLALRFARRGERGWSATQTIVARPNFGKYAEAPPWVSMLPNGALIAVWTEEIEGKGRWPGNYLFVATSGDQGKTWSKPVVVHSDRSNSEHSFASLAVLDASHADIVWLDARDYESKHKYRLMSAVISSTGSVADEETLDDDVCTCCPTAMVGIAGGLLAAYRDHTSQEIRDIYSIRRQSDHWEPSHAIHKDGWHINACPVNGPALAARGNNVVAAWYTGAEQGGVLRVAFSRDDGATFENPATIESSGNDDRPVGRPTLTLLPSGEALVAWIRRQKDQAELVAALARPTDNRIHPLLIASGSAPSLGYPRMQQLGSSMFLSWGGAGETKQVKTAILKPR